MLTQEEQQAGDSSMQEEDADRHDDLSTLVMEINQQVDLICTETDKLNKKHVLQLL